MVNIIFWFPRSQNLLVEIKTSKIYFLSISFENNPANINNNHHAIFILINMCVCVYHEDVIYGITFVQNILVIIE